MTHLRAVHPDVRNPPAQQQRSLLNYGVGALRPCCDSRQEQITGLVSEMLVANMLPVALVESPEFRALLSFLEPAYKPPCRQTMTSRLQTMAEKRRCVIRETMQTDATAVSVTTDIWTSMANDPYISLTASYITPAWTMRTPTLANTLMDERHTDKHNRPSIRHHLRLAAVGQSSRCRARGSGQHARLRRPQRLDRRRVFGT